MTEGHTDPPLSTSNATLVHPSSILSQQSPLSNFLAMTIPLTLTEMLAADPLAEHDKWKDGDFEVISSDNVRFRVPTYLRQAASCVLRSPPQCSLPDWCFAMIEAGSGGKRVELPESSTVLEVALATMAEGLFHYGDNAPINTEEKMVAVLKFFLKYDCQSGLKQAEQYVNTHCEGFNEVFSRLLAVMYMERDDLCGMLIDRFPLDYELMTVGRHGCLDYKQFALMPARYYWALAEADFPKMEINRNRAVGSPRQRFEAALGAADG